MKRCFISIDIPKKFQRKIQDIQSQLPDFKGKKTEPENFHLTLKFLGEIEDEKIEKVRERLNGIHFDKFQVAIDEIGVFNKNYVRIIWLHLTNCEELQEIIDDALKDLFEIERRFMGHLTIARVKSLKDKKYFFRELENIYFEEIVFNVNEFKLKESILKSEGPVYRDIEIYGLN